MSDPLQRWAVIDVPIDRLIESNRYLLVTLTADGKIRVTFDDYASLPFLLDYASEFYNANRPTPPRPE